MALTDCREAFRIVTKLEVMDSDKFKNVIYSQLTTRHSLKAYWQQIRRNKFSQRLTDEETLF
jgi:hypothetical protein